MKKQEQINFKVDSELYMQINFLLFKAIEEGKVPSVSNRNDLIRFLIRNAYSKFVMGDPKHPKKEPKVSVPNQTDHQMDLSSPVIDDNADLSVPF